MKLLKLGKRRVENDFVLWSRVQFLSLLPLLAFAWFRLGRLWLSIGFAIALAGFLAKNLLIVRWAREEDRKDKESSSDQTT